MSVVREPLRRTVTFRKTGPVRGGWGIARGALTERVVVVEAKAGVVEVELSILTQMMIDLGWTVEAGD